MAGRVCIVAARRTPQGRFLGALAKRSAVALAVHAGGAALEGIDAGVVDLVVLGNVVAAGQGMNIARQVALELGLPVHVPAYTVNMMCASGMQAVALAAQAVLGGEARAVLCGGTESMSNAPYLLARAREGYKLGDGKLVDALLRDGLVDTSIGEHMALTAECLARQYGVSREEQDGFALRSHRLYFEALAAGHYSDELAPMDGLDRDEHARPDTSLEKLASLKPAFDPEGTITAGNASGINDGAALMLVCEEGTAAQRGWQPLATLVGWAATGCEPRLMGLGPVHATRKLCQRLECDLAAFDTIEINEAFAAQTLACLREWRLDADAPRGEARGRGVNPDGGAIAVGHPIGTSGARLLVHLAHRIARGSTRRALATLCVGGGMGMAAALAPA